VDLNAPETILVRAPNWLGDVVMATPGLRALRSHFKDAHIAVQVRPGLEGVLYNCSYVDEVQRVDSYHQGFASMLREGARLRQRGRFDLGICIPESFSSAMLMKLAGVKQIVGYGEGFRSPLMDVRVPVPLAWGARRMVARERFVLGLMDAVGCKELGIHSELGTAPGDDARVEAILAKDGDAAQPMAVLAPGASYGPSKCWPTASFAEVGDALQTRGVRVALLGTASEAGLTRSVAAAMATTPLDFAGIFSLQEVKALIKRSALLVCNDAGARHIAAAFAVPSIVFFGPTSVEKTNLNLDAVEIMETDDSCRPCYKRDCPIDHRCMTGIRPENVIQRSLAVLGVSS
jgi:heptosyltransferase II